MSNGSVEQKIRAGFMAFVVMTTFLTLARPLPSLAQPIDRVDAGRLSCQALRALIRGKGAVIVRSRSRRSGAPLSDRYVDNKRFCMGSEITRFRAVVTRDDASCSLKICAEPHRDVRLLREIEKVHIQHRSDRPAGAFAIGSRKSRHSMDLTEERLWRMTFEFPSDAVFTFGTGLQPPSASCSRCRPH